MGTYFKKLPKKAIQIPGTINWADDQGNIYGRETRRPKGTPSKHYGEYFRYSTFVNHHNGYVYVSLKYQQTDGTYIEKQKRVHIIIATLFLENPEDLPVVGHKNNIKTDNRVDNLYWTTISENTQKAFDDGLIANAKGYDDSQSKPVIMFETATNRELKRFGSISEAAFATGINKTTISRQARYHKPVRKPYYFRFQDQVVKQYPILVVQYDFKTDKEIARFINIAEAAAQTKIAANTISAQCHLGKKPKWTQQGTYFLYSRQNDDKSLETIEIRKGKVE